MEELVDVDIVGNLTKKKFFFRGREIIVEMNMHCQDSNPKLICICGSVVGRKREGGKKKNKNRVSSSSRSSNDVIMCKYSHVKYI